MTEPVLQRRASDGGDKPPTLTDIYKILLDLKNSHDNLMDAFVLDDLGKPDYTGHRLAHKQQIASAAAMQQYKTGLTKSLLDCAMKAAITLLLVAVLASGVNYLRDHLK